jgi:hypothetical protein
MFGGTEQEALQVANQKLKEAAQAGLEVAKVNAQQKQVQAQTYANPVLLEIRKLELQKELLPSGASTMERSFSEIIQCFYRISNVTKI